MILKRLYLFVTLLVFCLGFADFAAAGVPRIAEGPHDFTYTTGPGLQGTSDEPCVYCHTPHGAKVTTLDVDGSTVIRFPLWNRTVDETFTGGEYTMYSSSTFTADDYPATLRLGSRPSGMSLLCLSCHDGVTTVDGVINPPPTGQVDFTDIDTLGDFWYGDERVIVLGKDLSDDHPISFVYNSSFPKVSTGDFNDPGANGANLGDLRLFNEKLECSTCHDPHDNTNEPFLRMSNANSDMCLTCHNK